MKISTNANKDQVVSNNQTQSKVEFSITKNVSKLFYMLRDGFYAYKVQTMVQEYMSNARDSHRKAKNNSPIHVTLPTKTNPSLIIRDFGTGMNHDELVRFSSYLDSSKDQDDEQTGGFGIGGKIGFAYTDSFMILSRQNGLQWTVLANKVESENGVMNISSPVKTNLPNGVDIVIPIKEKDFNEVYRAVQRCSIFWTVKPEYVNDKILEEQVKEYESLVAYKGNSWSILTYKNEVAKHFAKITSGNSDTNAPFIITVDGIVYQMSDQIISTVQKRLTGKAKTIKTLMKSLNEESKNSYSDNAKKCGDVVLHFKTNEIVVIGSREGITDKEENINAIVEKILLADKEFKKQLFEKIESELSPKESFKYLLEFSKNFLIMPKDLVSSYTNKEKIVVENECFALSDEMAMYNIYLGSRRYGNGVSPMTKVCLLSFSEIQDSKPRYSHNQNNRVYLLMKEELAAPVVKRKANQIPALTNLRQFNGYRVNEEILAKLKNLGIANSNNVFTIENTGNRLKQRVVNEDEINCFQVQDIVVNNDYYSTNHFSKEVVKTDLNTVKKGIAITNKDMQSFVKNLNKEDAAWLKESKVKFYILGEVTIGKLQGLKTIQNLNEFLVVPSKANQYYASKSDRYHNDDDISSVSSYLLIHFNKKIIQKSKGSFKSLCFENKVSEQEYQKFAKLKHLDTNFEQMFEQEIKACETFMQKLVNKNPLLRVISFSDTVKSTRSYPLDAILKNLDEVIKF